jgi:hypothetical protein
VTGHRNLFWLLQQHFLGDIISHFSVWRRKGENLQMGNFHFLTNTKKKAFSLSNTVSNTFIAAAAMNVLEEGKDRKHDFFCNTNINSMHILTSFPF